MEEQKYEVFFSRLPNSQFTFPDGSVALFTGGRFATRDPQKAVYLQYEIDAGHPHIYRKEDCLQLAEEDLVPDAEYRKQIIAEYLAKQAAIAKGDTDMGDYKPPEKLNVQDTKSVGVLAADSNGSGVATGGIAVKLPGLK